MPCQKTPHSMFHWKPYAIQCDIVAIFIMLQPTGLIVKKV